MYTLGFASSPSIPPVVGRVVRPPTTKPLVRSAGSPSPPTRTIPSDCVRLCRDSAWCGDVHGYKRLNETSGRSSCLQKGPAWRQYCTPILSARCPSSRPTKKNKLHVDFRREVFELLAPVFSTPNSEFDDALLTQLKEQIASDET